MCGILGLVKKDSSSLEDIGVKKILTHLYRVSESRGHDSSGIAVVTENEILVNKRALPSSRYIKTRVFNDMLKNEVGIKAVIAHARMETNGSFSESRNKSKLKVIK